MPKISKFLSQCWTNICIYLNIWILHSVVECFESEYFKYSNILEHLNIPWQIYPFKQITVGFGGHKYIQIVICLGEQIFFHHIYPCTVYLFVSSNSAQINVWQIFVPQDCELKHRLMPGFHFYGRSFSLFQLFIWVKPGRRLRGRKSVFFIDFSLVSRHDITYFEATNGFYPTNTPNAPI